jgi:hypothetical protein
LCSPSRLQQQYQGKNLFGDGIGISEKRINKKTEEVLIWESIPDISVLASFIKSSIKFSRAAAFSASETAASLAAIASRVC